MKRSYEQNNGKMGGVTDKNDRVRSSGRSDGETVGWTESRRNGETETETEMDGRSDGRMDKLTGTEKLRLYGMGKERKDDFSYTIDHHTRKFFSISYKFLAGRVHKY